MEALNPSPHVIDICRLTGTAMKTWLLCRNVEGRLVQVGRYKEQLG
jgi:hypothetical protein